MKRFYKFLMPLVAIVAMALPWSARAQSDCDNGLITVANAETQTTTTSYCPGYSTYNYSASEVLVPGAALEEIGTIYSMQFKPASTSAGTYFDNCQVYLANTTLDDLSAGWVQDSTLHLVYTGNLNYTTTDWQTITFDTAFNYTGGNLIVLVIRNHGSWSSGSSFAAYAAGATLARYAYTDSSPFSLGSIPGGASTGTSSTAVPIYRFTGCFNPPTCSAIRNLTLDAVSYNEATISWVDTVNSGVTYTIINMADSNVVATGVTDTTYTFTDLTSDTTYIFGVYADCGADGPSRIATVKIHTTCPPFSAVPLVYDFENDSVGGSTSDQFASCLIRLNNGSQYYGWPYVGGSDYNHTTGGGRGLYWYNTTTLGTYGDYQYVVLPAVDTDSLTLAELQLKFWARASSTSYYPVFEVGLMTTPTDPATFQLVKTIQVDNSTQWDEYVAPFDTYVGEGTYIAIRALRSTATWYAYVDDITVENIPACTPVVHLATTNISAGAARLVWDPQSMAPSAYSYSYNVVGDNSGVVNGSVSDPYIIITGLQPGTEYEFRVQADCGGDGMGAMATVTFTTATLGCLELDPSSVDSVLFSTSTTGQSGCMAYSSWGNTAYQAVWTADELIAAGLTAGGITGIDLGFTAGSSNKEFTIFIGSTNTSSISNATMEIPSDNMQVYGPAAHPSGTSGWQHYNFSEPFIWDGTSNILITTFMNQPTGTSQSSSTGLTGYYVSATNKARFRYKDSQQWTIDNLTTGNSGSTFSYRAAIHFHTANCMTQATCAAPVVLNSSVAATSVSLEWMPGGSESNWDILYRAADTNEWSTAISALSATSYTIENLTPNTEYEVMLMHLCGADTFATTITVTTPCLPEPVPFYEDFDSYASGSGSQFNACWYKHYTGSTNYPYVSTSYARSGSNSMYFYGYSSTYAGWLVLPNIDDSVHNLELSFWEYKTTASYGTVEIGVITDPTNLATFVPVQTVSPSQTSVWENMVVNFNGYTGPEGRIALVDRTSNGYAFYIDDLEVGRYSSCPRPQNLHAVHVTDASARLSWVAADSATSYIVKWGTSTNVANAIDSLTSVEATATDVTGLAPNTTYYAWVASVCAEEPSAFVRCSFTTAPACGSVQNLSITGVTDSKATIAWEAPEYGTVTDYAVTVTNGDNTVFSVTTTNTYLFLSNLDTLTTYSVSVAVSCSGDNSGAAVQGSFTTSTPGMIGSNEGTFYAPTYPYYNHSISEQLWLDSELGAYGDTINGIYFNAASAIADRPMQIWVGNTTLTDLSNSSYVPASSMTLVFDSVYDIESGWNYFPFSAPFVRTAGSNLVVMAHDAETYEEFDGWYAASSPVNSLYGYDDNADFDTNDLSGLDVAAARAQMRLDATLMPVTCMAPQLAFAGSTSSSVTLAWRAGLNETSWSLEYHLLGDTTWTTAVASTNDTVYTVNGLQSGSSYIFRLGALCAGQTPYATVNATTACGIATLPFYENFDNYANTMLDIPCWYESTSNSTISNTTYPYVSNLIGEGPMLRLYQGAYIALPEFDEALNTLQVRFKYLAAYNSVPMLFGYMSDPEDLNTFVLIDTLYTSVDNEARFFTITLDSIDENAQGHIAFYTPMPPVNYTFIDELYVEPIPACVAPDSVTLVSATPTTATLQWVGGNLSTSYSVLYRLYGTTAYDTVTATSNSVTLTGLTPSSNYEVAVFASCASLEAVSNASPVYRFATGCDVVSTLPYTDNFEGYPTPASYETGVLPNCWTVQTTTASSAAQQPQLYYGSSYAASGNYSLRMYYTSTLAMPEFSTQVDSLQVSFNDYVTSTDYAIVVGVVDSLTATAAFHPADTIRFAQTGQHREVAYLAAAGVTEGYIAFRNIYVGTYGYSYSYNYLDNIEVAIAPDCLPVGHISAVLDSASSITLDWTDPRPASQWQIAYASAPLTNPATGRVIDVTTHPYEVTGLSDDTAYYFYIRTVCGAGDSSAWTAFGPVRCHVYTMRANQTDTVYMCGGTIYDDGGVNGNYSASQSSYVVVMPSSPDGIVVLNGTVNTESCCDHLTIYDGIGTSGATLWTGEGTTTLTDVASTNGPLTIGFTSDGSIQYPGFALNVSCLFDPCGVSDVHVNEESSTSTSVNLAWSGSATSYEIEYGPAGFAAGSGTTITTTSNSVVINGLSPMLTYGFNVRGACNVSDTGYWHKITYTMPMCDNVNAVAIGDPDSTTTTSNAVPVNNFYRYTLSETIIDSAEIGGPTEISAIGYYYNYSSPSTDKTDVTIWLQPTNKTAFTSSTDLILLDTNVAVEVYHGALNCQQGWNTFAFTAPYNYNGHGNLVVIVDDNSNEYDGSSYVFLTQATTDYKALVYYSDSYNPDPTNASFSGTTNYYQWRPVMQLISCGEANCDGPANVIATATETTATVAFVADAGNYEVAIAETWDDATVTPVAITDTFYTFTGLTASTTYTIGVRTVCSATLSSDWVLATVTTDEHPCATPSALTVSDVTLTSATLGWTIGEAETQWELHVTGTNYDETFTVTTNPYTVTGLTPAVTYSFTVSAVCSETQTSDPSEAQAFTTASCQPVSGVIVSNVTTNSAQVSWTAVQGVNGYEVEYGASGFNQGAGTTVQASTNSASITGLTANMPYDVYVRSVCGDGFFSAWSSVTSFTTDEQGEGIDDVNSAAIALYPNPATTTVTISGISGQATVTIVDMNGRVNGEWKVENDEITLDLTGYAQGAYFVRITGEQQNAIRKLIVK